MARFDDIGIFWEDIPQGRSRGARTLGPMPSIPETGWRPPTELPNIREAPWISLDLETYDPELIDFGPGWARGKGHICGVSMAVPWGKWYFPIRHTVQPELNWDPWIVISWLKHMLKGSQPKIGANLLYDIGWLAQEGVEVNGPLYDCQYAEGLIDEEGRLALEQLGEKYLFRGKKSEVLEDWIMSYYMPPKRFWRREIYRSPITLVGPYAEEDAAMPQQILIRQWPELVRRGLLNLFEMECKLIRLLIAMRFAGITVDLAHAEKCKLDFTTKADDIHKQLEHIAGCSINVNAADSIAKAFDKHGLPYEKTRTGRPSFTADWLKVIKHPIPEFILAERRLRKLTSTFIDGYIFDAHVNGKVYASFHPMVGESGGARSGRFSSSDPNLQNIPIRTPEGREMRAMFTKDQGHRKYRSGDYSQIEYRLLAHFATGHPSADEVRARYQNDRNLDYHDMISHLIHSTTGYAVQLKNALLTGTMFSFGPLVREHIKTLNFACIAAGQRILTNRGLVPIEQVSLADKLWDGENWVHHEGVICKGYQRIISYYGVSATPDHVVYLDDGTVSTLHDAKRQNKRIYRTGINDLRLRYTYRDPRNDTQSTWFRHSGDNVLHSMSKESRGLGTEYKILQDNKLQMFFQVISGSFRCWINDKINSKGFKPEVRRNHNSLPGRQRLQKLWRSWYQKSLRVTGAVYSLLHSHFSWRELCWQGHRSGEQRRPLRTWQYSGSDTLGKFNEQTSERRAVVYDILNAGPNHRFTCEGKLVSNCVYGVGVPHLAEMLGVNLDIGRQVSTKFHEAVPFARTTMNAVGDEVNLNDGICTTILNRQSHFDLWEPNEWGAKGMPLMYKDALEEYGPNIRRAYLYAALNYKLQGSAADIMKKAMVDAWDNGVFAYTGVPRLTCHDELGFSDPGDVPNDAWQELVHTMEQTIPLKVPVRFDFKEGENWKDCKG